VINFDADNDGDIDLLTSAYYSNEIDIWKNDGANMVKWTKEIVGNHVGVNRALPADFDGDNDFDVVATGKFPTSKLSLWDNKGGTPGVFNENIINDQLLAFWALCVDDFDNDGDLDIIAGASVSSVVRWWENNLVTGINHQRGNAEAIMVLFPNPARNNFSVNLDNTYFGEVDIQLVSLSGDTVMKEKVVKDKKNLQIEFKNNNLSPGTYILITKCGSAVNSKKLLIY
jgi:hypothetical protein